MSLVLMAVGLLATAAGLVTIGFGIPINAFSLGNTLIIAGATGVGSGLVLIGLASVARQLKRIHDTLKAGVPAKPARPAEAAEAAAPIAPRAIPVASEPVAEPALPPAEPGPLSWLRAKGSKPQPAAPVPFPAMPAATAEAPIVDVTDEAPLSPFAPRPAVAPAGEPMQEPKVWLPNRDGESLEPRPAPRADLAMPRATPQPPPVEPARDKGRFDLAWPDRNSRTAPEPRLEPQSEAQHQPFDPKAFEAKLFEKESKEAKREPAVDMPLPPVPARPRETRPPERRMPEVLRKPAERGPAILKSGVIDGMPYTLYADGSIEAQLPQGMVKFASVDALRAHLEKQS